MLRTTLLISTVLAAMTAQAQTSAPDPMTNAPLISDSVVRSTDSPLVQAAKRALASRQKIAGTVIDNNTVTRSHRTLTTTGVVGDLPSGGGEEATGPQQYPTASNVDTGALRNRAGELAREAQKMRTAEEEGPYQDGTEDLAQRRLNAIPHELQDINRQLQQGQPAENQPPQSQPSPYPQ